MNIGVTNDSANGFKEAKEQRDYQVHLRKQYLAKKYGGKERGEAAFRAEQAQAERRRAQ